MKVGEMRRQQMEEEQKQKAAREERKRRGKLLAIIAEYEATGLPLPRELRLFKESDQQGASENAKRDS